MAAKYKLVKILNVEEVEEKMEMGICFICDKPFSVEHQLLHHTNIQMIMKQNEEKTELDNEGPIEQKMNEGHGSKSAEAYSLTTETTTVPPKSQGIDTFNHNTNVHEPETDEQIQKTPSSTTTIPPKSPSVTNSTPEFSDSLLSGNEDTKKTHVEAKVLKVVADSNSEMKNIARDSSFLTHCNVVSTPSIKEGFTANPNIDAYSLLQPALQVFDEMSMKKMKTISLSQLATMTASVPVMVRQLKVLLSFDNLKCFDPGGMIPLLFLPTSSVFISFQFPSRVSLPIPPEPPDWVAVQESSLQFPLCVTTEDFLRSSWRLQCYLQDLAAISESNGSVDYFNGLIKILLQHSQELTHELQFVHTWSYLSDFFHDVCLYSLGNIHSYFNDCARGRILHFVFKAGGIKHIIEELLVILINTSLVQFGRNHFKSKGTQ
ncbi:uncharacterized protein LOC123912737 [Trifolium pratense]|uniref:uncharacterized protein LOC123912737 n=1 Tax=Trifolium pratense TaxID=57577 RepID=UPI001E690395|nr:uncharacterized protein LOC123912737 [Trifolium pratense]